MDSINKINNLIPLDNYYFNNKSISVDNSKNTSREKQFSIELEKNIPDNFEENITISKSDIEKAKDYFQQRDLNVNFSVDKETGKQVIAFIDPETKNVVSQIPSKQMLNIIKGINLFLEHNNTLTPKSILLHTKA